MSAKNRIQSRDIQRFAPGMYPAIMALGESAGPAGFSPELLELMRLRVSQINGCAYCVQYHIGHLHKLGTDQAKINLVVAWEEAGIFSEREEATFAWAEAVTLLAVDHVPDAAFEAARKLFSEEELVCLTAAVCAINCWNRISVSFRHAPDI